MVMVAPDDIGIVTPDAAFDGLRSNPRAMLVDVRTRPEWMFVGTPDVSAIHRPLVLLEWVSFPAMAPNPGFDAALDAEVERHGAETLYFICRSGARSHDAAVATAARMAAAARSVACCNVVEGFEGPPDPEGHRGSVAGWKARGLPWRQT